MRRRCVGRERETGEGDVLGERGKKVKEMCWEREGNR
jgi:hypothetical protein